MNKKEITKRRIRGQTCDTCCFNKESGCGYGVKIIRVTNHIKYKDFPKERMCEHWMIKFKMMKQLFDW